MKKIIISFVAVFSFLTFMYCNVSASDYRFTWVNTSFYLEIGSNLTDYIYLPKATLYYLDDEVADSNLSYNRTGTGTFYPLSSVDVNKVGKYVVEYRVYDYDLLTGNCDGYSQKITFNVVDRTKPVISTAVKSLKMSYEVDDYDYTKLISYSDNYYDECLIEIVDIVTYGKLGDYQVAITCTDGSNNMAYVFLNVSIVDEIKPILTSKCDLTNIIELPCFTEFDVNDYFTCIDEYDGDITQNYTLLNYDSSKLGIQNSVIIFKDKSGNQISASMTFNIIDDVAPTIEFDSNEIIIYYQNLTDEINWSSYMINYYDNYDYPFDLVITINYLNFKKKIGKYEVYYSIVDSSFNESNYTLAVTVMSNLAPSLKIDNPVLKTNDSFDYLDYITLYDNSDEDIQSKMKIVYSDVDMTKPGIYRIEICVCNSSGLFTYEAMRVTVEAEETFEIKNTIILISSILTLASIGKIIYSFLKKKKLDKLNA